MTESTTEASSALGIGVAADEQLAHHRPVAGLVDGLALQASAVTRPGRTSAVARASSVRIVRHEVELAGAPPGSRRSASACMTRSTFAIGGKITEPRTLAEISALSSTVSPSSANHPQTASSPNSPGADPHQSIQVHRPHLSVADLARAAAVAITSTILSPWLESTNASILTFGTNSI